MYKRVAAGLSVPAISLAYAVLHFAEREIEV